MNKFMKLAGVAALASAAFAGAANAEDREFSWSLTVGGTSDYIFRGLSLHNEDPAAQGSIDVSYGIFYAGAWASNVGTAGDIYYNPMELDLYAGIKPVLGQFTFDFGILGYTYPVADDPGNYIELKAGVSTEIVKNLSGGVTLYWAPDQSNSAEIWTVEGSLAYTLPQVHIFTPSISGGIGYSSSDLGVFSTVSDDYVYWNVGLGLAVEKLAFDFRYWDTNIDQVAGDPYTGLSDSRFVFSVKATLP